MSRAQLSISVADRAIRVGKRALPLTPRFFFLYAYLALRRLEDEPKTGGWVWPLEVLRVPLWERNDLLSVGKQIRRHIQELHQRRIILIEAQQKIKGPFRLGIPRTQIRLDVSRESLKGLLRLTPLATPLSRLQEARFYEFIKDFWEGDNLFNAGDLQSAEQAFRAASSHAIAPYHRAAGLLKLARTLERQGDYAQAGGIHRMLRRDYREGPFSKWIQLSTAVLRAWWNYRNGSLCSTVGRSREAARHFTQAEKIYGSVLDQVWDTDHFRILGDAYNGLGHLRRRSGRYLEALQLFHRALDSWILSEYFYGIQAIYFNIGHLYEVLGDERAKAGEHADASEFYKQAIQWIRQRCMYLCKKLGIAYDTSEDHALLSALYLKTNDIPKAIEMAQAAVEMATGAGNKRDIVIAYLRLAKASLAAGNTCDVAAAIQACGRALGDSPFRSQLEKYLRQELPTEVHDLLSPDPQ